MRKSIFKLLALVLSLAVCFSQYCVFAQDEETVADEPLKAIDVMKAESFVMSDGTEMPYRLYVPEDYNPEKQYSFLLFLHGAGNRGNDNKSQVSVNTGLIDRIINGEKISYNGTEIDSSKEFIIVAPQCASEKQWVDTSWSVTPDPSYKLSEIPQSQYMTAVVNLIDKMKADYNLNSARMYITGLSMGGFGTWDLIARYPDLFAAAIPMGGAGDVSMAKTIAKTPVWTFHQLQDPTVSAEGTVAMVKALTKAGAEVKFTPYFDGVHNAWTKGYAEPDMLNWLYDHIKGKIKIAFAGDSVTWGAGTTNRDTEGYVGLTAAAMADDYIVGNFAVSGTSALYSAVSPWVDTPEYQRALEFKPDVLYIKFGANDIKNENWDIGKGNFKSDYLKIVDSFKAVNPNLKVIVGIPMRIQKANVYGTRDPRLLEEEAFPIIYEIASEIADVTVNMFDPLKDHPEMFPDFLHPNAEGHKIAAQQCIEGLKKMKEIIANEPVEKVSSSVVDNASDWAKDEIALSVAAGLMPLKLSTDYQADITREEFCELVVNILPKNIEATRKASFRDTKSEAVKYAYSVGVVNGVTDKKFEPEAFATRQEMAAMIYRAYKLIAPDARPTRYAESPDQREIARWALEATDFLMEHQILKGDEAGNVMPLNNTSREEAVLLAYRAFISAYSYNQGK